MTTTNIWSQMTPTMSTNDTLITQFFSTCIPDESQRVVSGVTEVSPTPDPLPPQERDTHEPPQMQNDLRMVHWFHGLGGDVNSWFKPSIALSKEGEDIDIVAPRKFISDTDTDYSNVENHDLRFVASKVGMRIYETAGTNTILNEGFNNYDRSKSIAIGHSQGGIVVRKIDEQQSTNPNVPVRFGGLVTVTSPNQGPAILDPSQQNDAIQFLLDFGANFVAGPVSALLFGVGESIMDFLPDFVTDLFRIPGVPTAEDIRNGLLNTFDTVEISYYVNEELPAITEDYAPGAEELENINSYDANMTSILAIASERPLVTSVEEVELTSRGQYTVKEYPVPISWATIHYFWKQSSSIYDLFEADKAEKETAIKMENVRLDYISKKFDWEEKLRNLEIERLNARLARDRACGGLLGWANPACWINRTIVGNLNRTVDGVQGVVDGFQFGIEEFNNFNTNYLTAMGLRELDQTVEDKQFCICFSGADLEETRTGPFPPGTECIPESSNENEGFGQQGFCYSVIEEVTTNNWTIFPSDGVLSVQTQMNIPQATEDPVIISKDNPSDNWNWDEILSRVKYGSTHMAIRNDDIGKNALVKLFDGDFGLFFETDEVD
jgi:predicted esterase